MSGPDDTRPSGPDLTRVSYWFERLVDLSDADRATQLSEVPEAIRAEVIALLRADDAPSPFDELVGELPPNVGPYVPDRELGRGGMGVVYLAHRDADGQPLPVALKVLLPTRSALSLARHYRRERDILANLRHPHIAQILDAGMLDDGRPYLALEYVAGVDIVDHAKTHGLTLQSRLHLVATVAEALAYAHDRGVVHRDIKPSNLLVDEHGQVKILDFGLATSVDLDLSDPSSLAGAGTPLYASPEQLRGHTRSAASDIFSLGMVLLELLSPGAPTRWPHGAPNRRELDADLAEHRPEWPRSTRRQLTALLSRMLEAKQPEQRPTAEEVVLALAGISLAPPSLARRAVVPLGLLAGTAAAAAFIASRPPASVVALDTRGKTDCGTPPSEPAAKRRHLECLIEDHRERHGFDAPVTIQSMLALVEHDLRNQSPEASLETLLKLELEGALRGTYQGRLAFSEGVARHVIAQIDEHLAGTRLEREANVTLGISLTMQGRSAEALQYYLRGWDVDIAAGVALHPFHSQHLANFGTSYAELGRYAWGLALLRESVRIREGSGNQANGIVGCLERLASVALKAGDIVEAETHLEDALHRVAAERNRAARALSMLAVIRARAGDEPGARTLLQESAAAERKRPLLSWRFIELHTASMLAWAAVGDCSRATMHGQLARLRAESDGFGGGWSPQSILQQQAQALRDCGAYAQAEATDLDRAALEPGPTVDHPLLSLPAQMAPLVDPRLTSRRAP